MSDFNDDSPVELLTADKLDYDVFALSIVECVLGIQNVKGGVIAVRGQWGMGKSSVIRMVVNELDSREDCPIIIEFNSWCYRFEDEIVAGFFQEFYLGLKSEVDDQNLDIDAVAKLGARIVGITKLFTSSIKLVAPGSENLLSFGQDILEKAIAQDQSIGSLQSKVSDVIAKVNRKILFVIDDIDRLSPEEAIAIFRVIKSVGRLDNVLYLLSYDRVATEKAIERSYPSEGSRYLEKIVQAGFDLPEPSRSKLAEMLMDRFLRILDSELYDNLDSINEIVNSIIIREIETPRNVHRLANVISITYPSVRRNVHLVDFMLIETLRVFRPNFYKKIQTNKNILIDSEAYVLGKDSEFIKDKVQSIFLDDEDKDDHTRLTYFLHNLFPLTNIRRSPRRILENKEKWKMDKRVCSVYHFDTYFRFSVSDDTVSNSDLTKFITNAGDKKFVMSKLKHGLNTSYNSNKISFLFDELIYNVNEIDRDDIKSLLVTLYSVADKLYVEQDAAGKQYLSSNNRDRIVELSKRLLEDRYTELNIPDVMSEICEVAPLDLLVQLCGWVCRNFDNDGENMKLDLGQDFMSYDDIRNFKKITLGKIKGSMRNSSISGYGNLYTFLRNWYEISEDKNDVRSVFRKMLNLSTKNVIIVANEFDQIFPESNSSEQDYNLISSIDRMIDVKHLVSKLLELRKSPRHRGKGRFSIHRVFDKLNEFD